MSETNPTPVQAASAVEREMSHEMRLKLDRRIHNQRVALRDNWMLVEQRNRSIRRMDKYVWKSIGAFLDRIGIPRGDGNITYYGVHKRLELAEALFASLKDTPDAG